VVTDADRDDVRPRRLVEPTTGRPILMAPIRQGRPFFTGPDAIAKDCPFCPGQEHRTPKAIDSCRLNGSPDAGHDEPGWTVRAFPNKYPANDHHIVVAEGDVHHEQSGDLDVATWCDVVAMWQRLVQTIEREPGVQCAFLFKNVGQPAGASIAHSHSQVIGLGEPPPRLQLEQRSAAALGHCPWCATIAGAGAGGRLVVRTSDHVVVTPDPPKLPYETWVLPLRCDDDFVTTPIESLATALQALFVAIRDALRRPAWNLWLHRMPGQPFHWHFELQPRTGQLAGLELGGDMYINSLPAAAAAQRLRGGLPQGLR